MKKTTLNDLRDHLFATIEALQDEENPMDIQRARAINDTAQTIINSAKVELDYLDLVGQEGNGGNFFPAAAKDNGAGKKNALAGR